MIVESQPCNPAVHALCIRIAQRCAHAIETVLHREALVEAARQFYVVCREELDKPPTQPEA